MDSDTLNKLLLASARALEHITELREAWSRGDIRETDNLGGQRSNRNVSVEVELGNALQSALDTSNPPNQQ